MNWRQGLRQPGVVAALGAALLFGGGTPLAKGLLTSVDPWLLAGLLYLGSGTGLALYRMGRHAPAEKLPPMAWGWLAGAIFAGGVVGPVLLMFGLTGMPASGAALLLNAEGVLTALLAWFVFRENFDRRIALGMAAIVAGVLVIGWPGEARFSTLTAMRTFRTHTIGTAINKFGTKLTIPEPPGWLSNLRFVHAEFFTC